MYPGKRDFKQKCNKQLSTEKPPLCAQKSPNHSKLINGNLYSASFKKCSKRNNSNKLRNLHVIENAVSELKQKILNSTENTKSSDILSPKEQFKTSDDCKRFIDNNFDYGILGTHQGRNPLLAKSKPRSNSSQGYFEGIVKKYQGPRNELNRTMEKSVDAKKISKTSSFSEIKSNNERKYCVNKPTMFKAKEKERRYIDSNKENLSTKVTNHLKSFAHNETKSGNSYNHNEIHFKKPFQTSLSKYKSGAQQNNKNTAKLPLEDTSNTYGVEDVGKIKEIPVKNILLK